MKKILLAILVLSFPQGLLAQATQFYLEDVLDDKLKVKIYVVADLQAKTQVQESLYAAVDHARKTLTKLNASDPSSELGVINQKKVKGEYMVSEELTKALEAGLEISRWSNGFFDITFSSPTGTYKEVKINRKNNELKIKADNIVIDFRYMMRGFLSDLMAQDLSEAGWKNNLVKIGTVYVARGGDISGPWKIPVATPDDKLAKRVLLYGATDVWVGTVAPASVSDVTDPKTKSAATSDLKSVTIFTQTASKAEGLAGAIYVMGSVEGRKFLEKNPNLRAVFADTNGKFVNIPEFKANP